MSLMVNMSLADILLMEEIVKKYMKENNIKNINEIEKENHEKTIQEMYNKITFEIFLNSINRK